MSPNSDLDLRGLFADARRRPRGFMWYGSYSEACAFVIGVDVGTGGRFLDGFQQFLGARHGGRSELMFFSHVLAEAFPGGGVTAGNALNDEQHAIAVDTLFELLDLYLSVADPS